jgi:glycosyltransferase involved in cell wall biosynthesis
MKFGQPLFLVNGINNMPYKKKIAYIATTAWPFNYHIKTYIEFFSKYYDVYIIFNNKEFALLQNIIKNNNITVININIKREINLLCDLHILFTLIKIFYTHKFDIIHSVTPKAGFLSMLAAKFLNINKRIHTFTGQVWLNYSLINKIIFKIIDSLIVNLSTNVFADSISQCKFLNKNLYFTNKSVVLIENGSIAGIAKDKNINILKEKYLLRKKLNINNNLFVVLFYGRINIDKGIFDFLMVAQILNLYNDILFCICGPDEKGLIKNLPELPSNIRVFNQVSHFSEIIPIADILIMPSVREGFGMVPLEAAIYKIPTIGYNIMGLTDSIINGVTGLLSDKGDINCLANNLLKFFMDRNLLIKFGDNAYENLDNFSQIKILSHLKTVYSQV